MRSHCGLLCSQRLVAAFRYRNVFRASSDLVAQDYKLPTGASVLLLFPDQAVWASMRRMWFCTPSGRPRTWCCSGCGSPRRRTSLFFQAIGGDYAQYSFHRIHALGGGQTFSEMRVLGVVTSLVVTLILQEAHAQLPVLFCCSRITFDPTALSCFSMRSSEHPLAIALLLSNAFVGILITFVYRFGNAVSTHGGVRCL